MKITKKQVEYVADLARLGVDAKEKKKFAEELSAILEFVDKLSQLKTDKIEPTARNKRETEKLLDTVPETKDGYVKVKAVL